jgi:ABC-type sugar transport system ATPase subunit
VLNVRFSRQSAFRTSLSRCAGEVLTFFGLVGAGRTGGER